MRAPRRVTPDLRRGERCSPSKAISSTKVGATSRTGPKRFVVLSRTNSSMRVASSFGPMTALPTGTSAASCQSPKVQVVGEDFDFPRSTYINTASNVPAMEAASGAANISSCDAGDLCGLVDGIERAGDEFDQCPAAVRVAGVEPGFDAFGKFAAAQGRERFDHFAQGRVPVRAASRGPEERDRLGHIADVIERECVEHRVHARFGKAADEREFYAAGFEFRRQDIGGERAVGFGRQRRIIGEQDVFHVVVGRRQAIDQRGEAVHGRRLPLRRRSL